MYTYNLVFVKTFSLKSSRPLKEPDIPIPTEVAPTETSIYRREIDI